MTGDQKQRSEKGHLTTAELARRRKAATTLTAEGLEPFGNQWSNQLTEIEEQMRALGADINPNSLSQVGHYIYDILKLKPIEGESARSVSDHALSRLAEQHEFPRLMREHRRVSKKYKAYQSFAEIIRDELIPEEYLLTEEEEAMLEKA